MFYIQSLDFQSYIGNVSPRCHLTVQCQQFKQNSNVRNVSKVNNKGNIVGH